MAALPEEILSHIFSHIKVGLDTDAINLRTLRNISLANWQCNRAARPSLYHTLLIDPHKNLHLLLRTLDRSPERALLIRRITVASETPDAKPSRDVPVRRPWRFSAQLLAAFASLDLPTTMKDEIRSGVETRLDHKAEYALLSCLSTRLEAWDLCVEDHAFKDSVIYRVLESASLRAKADPHSRSHSLAPRPFQHLSEIRVRRTSSFYGSTFMALEPILALPSLETFSSDRMSWSESSQLPEVMKSAVTRIDLGLHPVFHAGVDKHALRALLHACPNLEMLSLSCGFNGYTDLYYDQVGEALRRYCSKLVNLSIARGMTDSAGDHDPPRFVGSLVSLTSLQVLTVPWHALYDWQHVRSRDYAKVLQEILPPSLHFLRIEQIADKRARRLERYLSAVAKVERSPPEESYLPASLSVTFHDALA